MEHFRQFISMQLFMLVFKLADYTVTTTNSTAIITAVTTATINTTTTATPPQKTDFEHITMRAIYVIAAISGLVIVYFIVRALCSRRRRNRTRRYGMLKEGRDDHMEMRPLSEGDDDDDDDDLTLFDASQRKSKR